MRAHCPYIQMLSIAFLHFVKRCWALVNAALYPSLKSSLTRLGGVYAVTNAMMLHPNAEAVQFRGLFALINLVIPGEFFVSPSNVICC